MIPILSQLSYVVKGVDKPVSMCYHSSWLVGEERAPPRAGCQPPGPPAIRKEGEMERDQAKEITLGLHASDGWFGNVSADTNGSVYMHLTPEQARRLATRLIQRADAAEPRCDCCNQPLPKDQS